MGTDPGMKQKQTPQKKGGFFSRVGHFFMAGAKGVAGIVLEAASAVTLRQIPALNDAAEKMLVGAEDSLKKAIPTSVPRDAVEGAARAVAAPVRLPAKIVEGVDNAVNHAKEGDYKKVAVDATSVASNVGKGVGGLAIPGVAVLYGAGESVLIGEVARRAGEANSPDYKEGSAKNVKPRVSQPEDTSISHLPLKEKSCLATLRKSGSPVVLKGGPVLDPAVYIKNQRVA